MSISDNYWWEVNCWTRWSSTYVWWFVMEFPSPDVAEEPTPRSVIPWWCSSPRSVEDATKMLDLNNGRRSRKADYHIVAWGFPFRSFWLEYKNDSQKGRIVSGGWMLKHQNPSFFPRAIPFQPIWFGLLSNTVIYTAMLWILSRLPSAIRHKWRISRGLCPQCSYPIGASARCPECGIERGC